MGLKALILIVLLMLWGATAVMAPAGYRVWPIGAYVKKIYIPLTKPQLYFHHRRKSLVLLKLTGLHVGYQRGACGNPAFNNQL